MMFKPLYRLTRDTRGVTAVEFAMIAPVVLWMMMGIIELSLIMFVQNVMENATFMASRLGKTGFAESASTREETILTMLEQRAGTFLDTDQIEIRTLTYSRFDQVGDPEPYVDANSNGQRDEGENYTDVNGNGQYDTDMGEEGLGNAGEIVVYIVTYPWSLNTPFVRHFFGDSGVVPLASRAVIQNEPF